MLDVPRVTTRPQGRLHSAGLLAVIVFGCIPGSLSALPALTQVSEIRKLTITDARLGFPVRLRGVVTYFDTIGPDM